jgi:glycosyltransferase involved in cell wall biosynthesis
MRIAFITEYRGLGGGETNLLRVATFLSRKHTVSLYCANGDLLTAAKERLSATFSVNEIPPVRNLWRHDLPVPLIYPRLLILLRKFDVVHSYSPNPLPMLLWTRRPIIWTVHGPWERLSGRRAWWANHIVAKILPVSQTVNDALGENLKEKAELVYLGAVFEEEINPSYTPFNGKELNLCCVGSYQFIKGQDVLIDAIRMFAEKMPRLYIRVWLVGDVNGTDPAMLDFKNCVLNKIRSCSLTNLSIIVEGFRHDVDRYIKMSHLVVVPSRYESFSMITIESLARGKQVIGPNVGGPKEILNMPDIGYLFVPGNPESLCEALQRALENYPAECPKAALGRANQFTVEKQAEKLELIYGGLLSRRV